MNARGFFAELKRRRHADKVALAGAVLGRRMNGA
jgi:hypothetical protein